MLSVWDRPWHCLIPQIRTKVVSTSLTKVGGHESDWFPFQHYPHHSYPTPKFLIKPIITMLLSSYQFLLIGALARTISSHEFQQPLVGSSTQRKTVSQPLLGFGTWQLNLSPENTTEAVSLASKYRILILFPLSYHHPKLLAFDIYTEGVISRKLWW